MKHGHAQAISGNGRLVLGPSTRCATHAVPPTLIVLYVRAQSIPPYKFKIIRPVKKWTICGALLCQKFRLKKNLLKAK
jgi:hypothetical protein